RAVLCGPWFLSANSSTDSSDSSHLTSSVAAGLGSTRNSGGELLGSFFGNFTLSITIRYTRWEVNSEPVAKLHRYKVADQAYDERGMNFCDLSLPSPEENLACDEALLELAEEGRVGEVLRVWE